MSQAPLGQTDPRFVLDESEIQYLSATAPRVIPATPDELEALTLLPESVANQITDRYSEPRFPVKYEAQKMRDDWSIPRTAMHGKLRDLIKHCNTDISTAYLFALAALAPTVRAKGEPGFNLRQELTQTNLNVAANMPSGKGKGAALDQVCQLLWGRRPKHLREVTFGSEVGIMSLFPATSKIDDPNYTGKGKTPKIEVSNPTSYVCVTNDELAALFLKMNIENSALQTGLNSLWAQHCLANAVGSRTLSDANVELSILGSLPVESEEDFSRYFTDRFAEGFGRRILFSYAPDAKRPRSDWELPIEPLDLPPVMHVTITREITRLVEDVWFSYYDKPERKHLDRYAAGGNTPITRIAAITSAANGDKEITLEALHAAFALMDWQIQMKHKLRPGSSDKDSQTSERLLRTLKNWQDKKGYEGDVPRSLNYPALYRQAHLSRFGGAQKVVVGLRALHQNGQIELLEDVESKCIVSLSVPKMVQQ
jgi:hypothetical protein